MEKNSWEHCFINTPSPAPVRLLKCFFNYSGDQIYCKIDLNIMTGRMFRRMKS